MPSLHIFIDTNIFLNFYSFPDDNSSVLKELIELLGPDKINLHLPQQVEDEFWRNRESKLSAAIVEFKNANLPTGVPNHMRGTETAKQYHEAIESAGSARKKLVANVIGLAVLQQLDVDVQVEAVFGKAVKYDDCEDILARAVFRMHKGNPPGKAGNIGDRYNWETLLAKAPNEDLYIVTKDGDFTSVLSSLEKAIRPMPFLAKEWAAKAEGRSVYVYSSIRALLDHYKKLEAQPDEEPLQPEEAVLPVAVLPAAPPLEINAAHPLPHPVVNEAKEKAIELLLNSQSFAQTHHAIDVLDKMMPLLTATDADKLFEAATTNQQISWIISDTDVHSFFVKLLNMHFVDADSDLVDEMIETLGLGTNEAEEPEA